MNQRCPGASNEPDEGSAVRHKPAPERDADEKAREQVVAPDPDSVWAEISSIVEIEAEPPELPRWLRSS
jgi:hypothetical protein